MELVLRAIGIYFVLILLFRLLGTRSMSDLSAFDFILFLIVSEAIQNALVDDDKSVVMGMAVILTFVMMDLGLSILKRRYRFIEKIAEGVPVILVDNGKLVEEHLRKSRITHSDILQAARSSQGLENIGQIKYAVLETTGNISIIPVEPNVEEMLDRRIESALKRLGKAGN
ncbi:MAG TPA: YetF domain-containing protein [Noviherbaspirillum sp.]|jgi:uncharacterized membrane protein YcaP (DUF421 family)|uniref:DUF421 domain-containing protein n=1 Tax=Noviherbaspirillum sp. TaxID=1926288 RepID=UPI002DDC997E|nr:YetF domain-containing protein [Noviherbaspirillum sp.]HEV2609067.1 YetF domain-containing protein [Noviherbaspirillum sp.]